MRRIALSVLVAVIAVIAVAVGRGSGAEEDTLPAQARRLFAPHWRADRRSVEDQATQALVGPPSFGNASHEVAMARLRALPGYTAQFARAFPGQRDPVTAENWGKAIGAYERTLVTPAPFDAYLAGDLTALSPAARAGLQEFIGLGCATCHNGAGVGGGMLQKFGLVEDYWKETGSPTPDKGRFDVTHDPADLYVFKVPSLRNVAMTPPYFHDGSVAALPDAVRVMAKVQFGRGGEDVHEDQLGAVAAAQGQRAAEGGTRRVREVRRMENPPPGAHGLTLPHSMTSKGE